MPTQREWALLALAPVLVFAAGRVDRVDRGDAEPAAVVVEATEPAKPRAEASQVPDARNLDLAQLRRNANVGETQNVFERRSWYVPPPPSPPSPPPKPVAPPPPAAPPLPFTYLGRYEDAAKAVIFLVRGERILLVTAGEVIEGTYRVEGIVGAALGLTYLPLNIRQTLNVGTAG